METIQQSVDYQIGAQAVNSGNGGAKPESSQKDRDKKRSMSVIIFVMGLLDRLKKKGRVRGGDYCELTSEGAADFNRLEADGFKPTFDEIEGTYASIVVDTRRECLGLPPVEPNRPYTFDVLEAQSVIDLDSTGTQYKFVGKDDHTNPEYVAFNNMVRVIVEEAGVEVPTEDGLGHALTTTAQTCRQLTGAAKENGMEAMTVSCKVSNALDVEGSSEKMDSPPKNIADESSGNAEDGVRKATTEQTKAEGWEKAKQWEDERRRRIAENGTDIRIATGEEVLADLLALLPLVGGPVVADAILQLWLRGLLIATKEQEWLEKGQLLWHAKDGLSKEHWAAITQQDPSYVDRATKSLMKH